MPPCRFSRRTPVWSAPSPSRSVVSTRATSSPRRATSTPRASSGAACETAAAAADSSYCKEAQRWAIHEMTHTHDNDPAAFQKYWGEYLAFTRKAQATAPASIRDDWDLKVAAEAAGPTPVLEKYHFDVALI